VGVNGPQPNLARG